MADGNGRDDIWTGDPRVDAALRRMRERSDERFRNLEDTLLVQAELEARMARQVKGHAEWLERHEEIWRRIDLLMAEMTDKVNFLIDREMRREGGAEAAR